MSVAKDKTNTFWVNTPPMPPAAGKQINTGSSLAAPPDPLKNFKHFWIYFPWGPWYNQRGQFCLEKENIEEILSGKLVLSEKGWLPRTAAGHFQTHEAFTDLHSACTSRFFQPDQYNSALPDCRAGLLFPCPLKPKRYPAKPRSPVCSWHGGQKKVGKDQQV